MHDTQHRYSIGEVAADTGLSVHALRWYEKQGLFPDEIERTAGGTRVFGPEVVYWITLCVKLRETGMPIAQIHEFATLVKAGPGNEHERLRLLEQHEDAVRARINALHSALEVIAAKSSIYRAHLDAGTAAELWTPTERTATERTATEQDAAQQDAAQSTAAER